jgi:hypothetical protein
MPFVNTITKVFARDVARYVCSRRKNYLSFVVTSALTLPDIFFDCRAVSYKVVATVEQAFGVTRGSASTTCRRARTIGSDSIDDSLLKVIQERP